jgi:excinuclease ABC subunit C
MLPARLIVKNGELPDNPGVYFYFDEAGELLYVGKATSLRKRVGSYFTKAHDGRIAEMVSRIARIDYLETPTVIEALVLEANQIKAKKPRYNVLMADDKTYLYLVITNEKFPRPLLMRGLELEKFGVHPFDPALPKEAKKKFLRVFGPYTSGHQLKKALDLLRRSIPWSDCQPPAITGRTRSCFNVHIGKCPGVCAGVVDAKTYRRIIRHLILFFEGKKAELIRMMEREMKAAAKAHRFEEAARLRNNVHALQHIRDVALITKEDVELPFERTKAAGIDLDGRIEAYDISNISGTAAVGSMVVFEEGRPAKSLYRKFRIKTVVGSNDFASMAEVLRRRLSRAAKGEKGWPLPQVMVIDGGEGQVSAVKRVMDELGVHVPMLGIAKGFDRKQDRLVYDRGDLELAKVIHRGKELFQKARDESHRFAVSYHRKLRGKKSLGVD